MIRFAFLLLFFQCFESHAQSFLGHTKEEIQKLIPKTKNMVDPEVKYIEEGGITYLKVTNDYETLHYYLDEGVCVQFEVIKPYSCNCLKTDYAAYQEHCLAIGKLNWVSSDYALQYKMELLEDTYRVTVKRNDAGKLSEVPKIPYTAIVQNIPNFKP